MSAQSTYIEDKLINHLLRNTAFTTPGTDIYCSLHSADPSDTGASELSGGSYARVQVSSWDAPSSRAILNTGSIAFPMLTATIATATHMGFWDATTNGNFLWGSPADGGFSLAMTSGSTPTFGAGAVSVSLVSSVSSFLATAWLNHVFRDTAYTTPGTSIYISLHTSNPGLTGSGEVSGNNYARKQVSSWDAPSDGVTQNTGAITFDTPSGNWGTVTHFGVWDGLTGGNFLLGNELDASVEVVSGTAPSFAVGVLEISAT